jgi:hypothetical protein
MANRPITILGINPSDNSLILSDNGNTNVNPSDTVSWHIGQNSGVAAITAITDNNNSTDVFNPDPAPIANSTNWQGTVSPTIAKGTVENYTILWVAASGSGMFRYDPKISVNP